MIVRALQLGPARLPVNTPETAQVRRSCLSPPPEAKSLLIESSDEVGAMDQCSCI